MKTLLEFYALGGLLVLTFWGRKTEYACYLVLDRILADVGYVGLSVVGWLVRRADRNRRYDLR